MPRILYQNNKLFLSVFAIYMVSGAISLFFYDQGSEVLFLQGHQNWLYDLSFRFFTSLVEGYGLFFIAILLLLSRFKYFLFYLIDILTVWAAISLLKFVVFPDRIRPALYLGSKFKLHFVPGVEVMTMNSFPSGHTTSAFAVCFLLAILVGRRDVSILLLVVAMMIGFSRIYLIQHFWIDVYFGSVLGVLITVLLYFALQRLILHSDSSILNFSIYERYLKKKG